MDNNDITIELPIMPGLKSYILSKLGQQEPIKLSKTDPLCFGTFFINSLNGKRHSKNPDSRYSLKRYKATLSVCISTSVAERAGVHLTNEKIKDINDFIRKTLLFEFNIYLYGAKNFHANLVEQYAFEDYKDFLGIREDDYHLESLLKEIRRKRTEYTPRV